MWGQRSLSGSPCDHRGTLYLTPSQFKVVLLSLRSLALHCLAAVQEGGDTGGVVTNVLAADLTGVINGDL